MKTKHWVALGVPVIAGLFLLGQAFVRRGGGAVADVASHEAMEQSPGARQEQRSQTMKNSPNSTQIGDVEGDVTINKADPRTNEKLDALAAQVRSLLEKDKRELDRDSVLAVYDLSYAIYAVNGEVRFYDATTPREVVDFDWRDVRVREEFGTVLISFTGTVAVPGLRQQLSDVSIGLSLHRPQKFYEIEIDRRTVVVYAELLRSTREGHSVIVGLRSKRDPPGSLAPLLEAEPPA